MDVMNSSKVAMLFSVLAFIRTYSCKNYNMRLDDRHGVSRLTDTANNEVVEDQSGAILHA